MNCRGHIVGGMIAFCITLAGALAYYPKFPYRSITAIFLFFSCIAGALFPDIDTYSTGQKLLYTILVPFCIVALITKAWQLLLILLIAALLPQLVKHRGIMHSIWFIILVPCIILYGPYSHAKLYYMFFVTGALSHLLLDFGPYKLFLRTLFFR